MPLKKVSSNSGAAHCIAYAKINSCRRCNAAALTSRPRVLESVHDRAVADGWTWPNHKKVALPGIRRLLSPALLLAALLAGSACMPPIAFHDGLPAWAAAPGEVEWRVGYQRLSAFGADSFDFLGERLTTPNFSVGYFTPGMRVGLKRKRLDAEVGFTSAIEYERGFSALLGGEVGLGYQDPKISIMFRPSLYLFDIYSDNVDGTGVDVACWSQVSMLVGNGYRARGLNYAVGGRASEHSAGPVALIGVNLRPVEYRVELSLMLPVSIYASGRALTIGVTIAAPTKPTP